MKKRICIILAFVLSLMLAATAMAEASCSHSWGNWVTRTAATCTTDGQRVRVCTLCGDSETQPISATGHAWGNWTTRTAATCAAEGQQVRVCGTCGESQTQPIPMVDHVWGDWVTRTAATCTAEGQQVRVCGNCGETQTQPIPMTGHAWGKWVVNTAATCTTDGEQVRTCTNCGETQTEVIPMTGHQFTSKTYAPTTTSSGYTKHTCKLCGYSYKDAWKNKLTSEKSEKKENTQSKTEDAAAQETGYGDILTDEAREPMPYETSLSQPEGTEGQLLTITATPDADGAIGLRNLHISVELLAQLKEEGITQLQLVVGNAALQFPLDMFDSEDVKLIEADMPQPLTGYVITLNPNAAEDETMVQAVLTTEEDDQTDITIFLQGMALTLGGEPASL